jgi:hypothetical protein
MTIKAYIAHNIDLAGVARRSGQLWWAKAIIMQVRFKREGSK